MPENFYNSTRIKKKLPKQKDEQFQYTLMKLNKHFMIAAGTGGGKTNALYSYLIETSKPKNGTFKHIFIVYKTDEPLYDDLKEQIQDGITFVKSISELPDVDEFPDSIEHKYKYNFLVVFDDCVNDKSKQDYDKVKKYFTYGRKKGITICYLTQSFYTADSFIRKQLSYILLLGIKGKRDLNNILSDFGSLEAEPDELYRVFKYATTPLNDNDIPFLKICTEKCPENQKFTRDWIELIPFQSKN
jgi:hypothetical protein